MKRMRRIILLLLSVLSIAACTRNELPPVDPATNMVGLALPVSLEEGQTRIPLSDFIVDTELVDSAMVRGLDESLYMLKDGDVVIEPAQEGVRAIMALEVTAGGLREAIPLLRSGKQRAVIEFDPGGRQYSSVTVRGEFNGWTAHRPDLEFSDGTWSAELLLDPGTYQYLLHVDGEDMIDPANPDSIDNGQGGYNSLLSVGLDIAGKVPVLHTREREGDRIGIGIEGAAEGIMVFWQNVLLPDEYYSKRGENRYEIMVPDVAKELQRSFIRVWAWNVAGVSNDLLIPLEYGSVLDDPAAVNRFDMHAMILYNAFVDRFFDADTSNNRPLNIPEVRPPADYHGGDIKGVTQKISDGYFRDLGINTVWVSPLVKNPEGAYGFWPDPPSAFSGYHGYWPVSFTQVDDRYGTGADLHELVSTAHENGMNVLLDFVANHVHELHPVYQEHPEWATELYLPDGSLNTERWDEYRLTTWFDVFLPTLDLSKPEVYEMLTDSALYWIKKYDLDGFRHDATKHIPLVFWRELSKKLKAEVSHKDGRQLYQIGETYGGPDLISSYVGSGMLDAQFDFNVYDDALAVLIRPGQSFSRLDASLKESLRFYGSHNLMGYISGNQDRGRFTSYAGGDLHFDEDPKLAGWTRDIGVGDPSGYSITGLLFAFNMTIPGLPVIYYGDEIGMAGGNDPDCRRMMRFENLNEHEHLLREKVKKLSSLRRNNLPLIYGDFESLQVSADTYVYCRSYFDELAVVALNKSGEQKNIIFELPHRYEGEGLQGHFGSEFSADGPTISIALEPLSFEVLTFE